MTVQLEVGVTEQEANSRAVEELKSVAWASPLLEEIRKRGGLKAPASFLFELRFAAEVHRVGFAATYEYKTGVGLTSVDFFLDCKPDWLVELLSPEPHSRSDEESQMLKFAGILSDKACRENGLPSKFPIPTLGRYHLVIVDVRDYLYGMGDVLDWRQIAYGVEGVKEPHDWALHWLPKEVKGQAGPICGVFDPRSPVQSAKVFQERVHFIGFMNERSYLPGRCAPSRLCIILQIRTYSNQMQKPEVLSRLTRSDHCQQLILKALKYATPSVFHQRHIGRVPRSSCNARGRRLASSRGREPRPGRCPPLWPDDLRNDGGSVSAAAADGSAA